MLAGTVVEQNEVDASSLRRAMGRFATGVTVITARNGEEFHGMTANSITTVSFDPLLVLFCVNKKSRLSSIVQQVGSFAINVLAAHQENISRHFAGSLPAPAQLPYGTHFEELAGTPALGGSISTIACQVHQVIEAGDHNMVLGKVLAVRYLEEDTAPLVYFRGRYRHLEQPQAPEPERAPHFWIDSGMRVYYEEW